MASDPVFFVYKKIRNTIYSAITSRYDSRKEKRTEEMLGCSVEFFRSFIEAKFTDGMEWGNHGVVWQLDHICPVSQAKNTEELMRLQYFENFQPLMCLDNLIKSDKPTPEAVAKCSILLGRSWTENK